MASSVLVAAHMLAQGDAVESGGTDASRCPGGASISLRPNHPDYPDHHMARMDRAITLPPFRSASTGSPDPRD